MRFVRSTLALMSLVSSGFATRVAAQIPLATSSAGRSAPGGNVVVWLQAGTKVAPGATRGADVLVTLEGWVDASLLGGKRDTFPASVRGRTTLRVRATPSLQGTILAELHAGVGVVTLGRQGTWTRVRRSVWIPLTALKKGVAKVPERPKPRASAEAAAVPPPAAEAPPPSGSLSVARGAKVLAAPGGRAVADIAPGAVVQPLVRERGWVRVRVEGWVSERDLSPADSSFGATLTAADLRANPEGTRGKVVQWDVQVLSLQTADPLRPELARDEPYLLAKGPGDESVLLYVAVPPSLLSEAKAIPPLTRVRITARVRSGRSAPVGTPILDLTAIARR